MSETPWSDEVTERDAGAGYHFVELLALDDGSEADLDHDWGSQDGPVRIQPGRVYLESFCDLHYPVIRLRAYRARPSDGQPDGLLGVWPVVFCGREVSVWSGDSLPGEARPLRLEPSPGGQYGMRVAVTRIESDGDIDDYALARYEQDGDQPHDLESFSVDFWPKVVADS